MAEIETLVSDIEQVLLVPKVVAQLSIKAFGDDVGGVIARQLAQEEERKALRMSNLGTPCVRQLQYKLDPNIVGEQLPPNVRFKFMYGHVIEALILLLAREAGHTITGEQDELVFNGVKGHRDAIIDNVLVDVKSAASRSFDKFARHLSPADDAFGYLVQLGLYHHVSVKRGDPVDPLRAAFLVIDKQFGHICLDVHEIDPTVDWEGYVEERKRLSQPGAPRAPRAYFDEADGVSGNRKLGTACSYCAYKAECWPSLTTYLYASGPRYLTRVVREPKVDKF